MFSQLSKSFALSLNSLTKARQNLESAGVKVFDFTQPQIFNDERFLFPESIVRSAFVNGLQSAQKYAPHPLGQPKARQAVSRYYEQFGFSVSPENVLMTPGSSIAYWYFFRLLVNPGEEVLCPMPSYPLFEHIGSMADVSIRHYPLKEFAEYPHWRIAVSDIENCITEKTRAIVIVSPHNPTGWVASAEFFAQLALVAQRHQLPIIHDEVFSGFVHGAESLPRPQLADFPLFVTLNGLSKNFGLPGLKLGWAAVGGERVQEAVAGLEFFNDLFLPVQEAVQFALPEILRSGQEQTANFKKLAMQGLTFTQESLKHLQGAQFLGPESGCYGIIRLDWNKASEKKVCLDLLEKHRLLLHPGLYYDIPGDHLVFSFLHPSADLKEGLSRLAGVFS